MNILLKSRDKAFAGMTSFKIQVQLVSEEAAQVAEGVRINSAHLIKKDDPDVFFGFSRSVLIFPQGAVDVSMDCPIELEVDVLEYDEDVDRLSAGSYELLVGVPLFVLSADGGYVPKDLRATFSVQVEPQCPA